MFYFLQFVFCDEKIDNVSCKVGNQFRQRNKFA